MIVPDDDDEILIQMELEAEIRTEKIIQDQKDRDYQLSFEYNDIEVEDVKKEEEELEQEIEPVQTTIIQETFLYNIFDQDSSSTTQLNYYANDNVKVQIKIEDQDESQFILESSGRVESLENLENLESLESLESLENQENIYIDINLNNSNSEESDFSNNDISLNIWLIQPSGDNQFVLYDCYKKFNFKLVPQHPQDQQDYLNLLFFQYSEQYQEFF